MAASCSKPPPAKCMKFRISKNWRPLEDTGRNVNLKTQHSLITKQMLNKRLIPLINSSRWRLTERLVPILLRHSARCSPLSIQSAKLRRDAKLESCRDCGQHIETEKSLKVSSVGLHVLHHERGLSVNCLCLVRCCPV